MGSLTIRNLRDDLKQRLRVRAVSPGRSVREEVRQILMQAGTAAEAPARPSIATPSARTASAPRANLNPAALAGRRVVLVMTGGIAAYKGLDLIRRLKERGAAVRVVMTKAAQEFVTPLAAGALSGERVYTDLFDAATEFDVGHIRIARDADAIVVAPCTADFIAKMAQGFADDLASAVLLATERPVLIAPAMNPQMWAHAATQRNVAQLAADGIAMIGPESGEMAESGEAGT